MPTPVYSDELIRLINHAIGHGAKRVGFCTYEWNIAPMCQNPYSVIKTARQTTDASNNPVGPPLVELQLLTKCRKCTNCLRSRSAEWRERALSEVKGSTRTWFATFTFNPENRYRLTALTAKRVPALEQLEPKVRFAELVKTANREITLYLKRLRKNTGAVFKYMIVAEAHKDGNPHFHGLFHELDAAKPLLKKHLTDAWKQGFTSFKLVNDPKMISYVTKYIAKDASSRIRSSFMYGLDHTECSQGEGNNDHKNLHRPAF